MEICSIASGSSGNCIYIASENSRILIDVGISGKRIREGLQSIGVEPEDLTGILITHEHSDHISGLGVLCRKYGIPVYTTKGTKQYILNCSAMGKLDESLFQEIEYEVDFMVGDLLIHPFAIAHDAAQPVAYVARHGEKSIGVATDMGHYDENIIRNLTGLDAVLIEANHDVNMLQVGSYPYYLKRRILSDQGHLSNENSGRLLSKIMHNDFKCVMLGHLSKENNMAELAYETVRQEMVLADGCCLCSEFSMFVAKRDQVSQVVTI